MFATRFDRAFGVCVWYFAGAANTDDDFERYVESFTSTDAMAVGLTVRPVGILFVEAQNPMPNAVWRKRMADASKGVRSNPCVAFAGASSLVRGVVTAINWLRPPPFEFHVTSTFAQGVAWLEGRRGTKLPRLEELFAECRDELVGGR